MQIRNIWCVARNFRDHAKELNNPVPKEPLFFLKAGSCAASDEKIALPRFSSRVEYEIEIALQFGSDLSIAQACLALDLTARDLQLKAKQTGEPWTLAKSFPHSCPIGPFFPVPDLKNLVFELHVNGALRQKGNTSDMVFSPDRLISYLKAHFPVCPGDLLLTGTPSGISQAHSGDLAEALIPGLSRVRWAII